MAKYVCSVCGYTVEGEAPEKCPICGAVREVFTKIEEGNKAYATEHVIGIAQDVDPMIKISLYRRMHRSRHVPCYGKTS